jgi:ribosomal protein S4E
MALKRHLRQPIQIGESLQIIAGEDSSPQSTLSNHTTGNLFPIDRQPRIQLFGSSPPHYLVEVVMSVANESDRDLTEIYVGQWITVMGGMHKGRSGYIAKFNDFKSRVYLGDLDWTALNNIDDVIRDILWNECFMIDNRFLEKRFLLQLGTRVEIIRGKHLSRHGTITKMNTVKHEVLLDSQGSGMEKKLFTRSFMIPVGPLDESTRDDSTEDSIES